MPPSHTATPRIAFVVCPSFHGATLLAMLLSRHPDVINLGDTIPSRRVPNTCSCGGSVDDCPFWQEMRREVVLDEHADQDHWLPNLPRFTRRYRLNWGISLALAGINRISRQPIDARLSNEAQAYRAVYHEFVAFAGAKSGATIFVDGTKGATRAIYLMSGEREPSRVIHLYRDPRGFALSAASRGTWDLETAAKVWRHNHEFATVSLRWLGGYPPLKVRYEDVATNPDASIAAMLRYLGATPSSAPERPLSDMHVIGNRMVKEFDGSVRPDERWRDELSPRQASDILRWSGPLARRMGYTMQHAEKRRDLPATHTR